MHNTDFVIDLDVNDPQQVASPRTVNIGIKDGLQAFPPDDRTKGANRLLIFTGTGLCGAGADPDGDLTQGVVRVRLRFPLPQTVIFKAAATLAGLASLHGESEQDDLTFAADAAVTVTDPTDAQSLANPNQLPDKELYLIIDVAVQGGGSVLNRIAYQANVLVQDTEPDLDSILVRRAGGGTFQPSADFTLSGGEVFWDFQLRLTGPAPQTPPPFSVQVDASDSFNVVVPSLVVIPAAQQSIVIANNPIAGSAPIETVTITATAAFGKHTVKTATLVINHLK
jgi:hypothetical protein